MTDSFTQAETGLPTQPEAAVFQSGLLKRFRAQCAMGHDLWVFGYASLLWRPEFEAVEQHRTQVWGWHRALKMWSRVNRGSPQCPGLVFALLPGGSCKGVVYRIAKDQADEVLTRLWAREMPMDVYTPNWLPCATPKGPVKALAFTLPRSSPSFTGDLTADTYRQIFQQARGRFGTTLDYALQTYRSLQAHGIEDRALAALLRHAE
ncbi:gamma-glutamylcyclotransferase [Limnohabitans sp. T6-5]|uniref:gamma-glutamylcyclotransferase n=1 Tax=Limnohabitans sp. T6-5 TaxID=1100724 RepID=UPI000D366722|nr:gamma-glutamylcyclotransferase [Limnohabitans sp. T6-5]